MKEAYASKLHLCSLLNPMKTLLRLRTQIYVESDDEDGKVGDSDNYKRGWMGITYCQAGTCLV